jgi:hypothetical protein
VDQAHQLTSNRVPAADVKPDAVRKERIRADAARPMAVNLAAGIELSHKLLSFTGAARRPRE